jgi:hypothetical protein
MKFIGKGKHWLVFLSAAAGILLISSCYTDYGLSIQDYDLTITTYDESINFQNWHTYAITDTVEHIVGEDDEPDRTFDAQILNKIKAEMNSYGWREVSMDRPRADGGILLTVSEVDNYSYWGYYPGWWWGPGWGWYYPPYYGGVTYAYSSGSIFINMVDIARVDTIEQKVPSVWFAGINGITNDSDINLSGRIDKNIEQAFKQSPYLDLTK